MAGFYNELVTVTDVRSTTLSITGSGDDTLVLKYIREVSQEIARMAERQFVPRIETRYFDPTRDTAKHDSRVLRLDRPLLAVTTLTNGDADALATTEYVFEPRNQTPYYAVQLLASSGLHWTYDTDAANAISLLGIWGYHDEYASAWGASGATLAAAITTTSATSFTCTTGIIKAGMLLQIDSEMLYASSVAVSASDTVTCVRAVNGSTAATHLISTAISVWQPVYQVEQLAREAVSALYRLRANPLAEAFVAADGVTFTAPKDVHSYIEKRVRAWGMWF